jgi:hypothetical protein
MPAAKSDPEARRAPDAGGPSDETVEEWLGRIALAPGLVIDGWRLASADGGEGHAYVRLRFERGADRVEACLQPTDPASKVFGRSASLDLWYPAVPEVLARDVVRFMTQLLNRVRAHDAGDLPPPPCVRAIGLAAVDDSDQYVPEDEGPPRTLTAGVHAVWAEIEALGLVRQVAELEMLGYTVVPPDVAAPPGFTDRLLDAVLAVAERRMGARIDPFGRTPIPGGTARSVEGQVVRDPPRGIVLTDLLYADRAFEEALMNPPLLALVTYLLGYQCRISAVQAWLKPQGSPGYPLHWDGSRVAPAPPWADCCNAAYVLTDHTADDGATCFVPGTHRLLRAPISAQEGTRERVALRAPKGSLAVWNGYVWHGSFRKRTPGLRISVPLNFCRPQYQTFEEIRGGATREMIERNPPRFRTLVGEDSPWGAPTALNLPRMKDDLPHLRYGL